jgi:hypothetical protein
VAVWDELKIVLAALQQQDPLPLTSFPGPEFDQGRRPPFEIGLAAWATHIAEQLHDRFGGDVMLTVGAMRYPQRALAHEPARLLGISTPVLGPGQATIAWATPLRVRSGHTAQHDMAITNVGTEQVKVSGPLIAEVVDLDSGEIVGGYTGAVSLVLMIVVISPGATRQIPVLVGTDSLRPDLGYALPPGEWGAQTTLWLAGSPVRTPILPVTITT